MERSSQTYSPLGIGSGSLIAGRYEIDLKLGAGATSAVYKARDKALGNSICAIKIIDTKSLNTNTDIERIKNEVLITRKLTHPNVVRTYEYGTTSTGQLYITMEYVEGKSLESLLNTSKEEGLLSTAEVVYYLKAIASALASAHEAQIIHRDLKPANVLVSKDGEVKITDFGLAKQQELDLKLTIEGECVGTPAYMSPEQIQGHKLDHRTDIYSFGIMAYELITGNLPFKGNDWFSLGKSIIMDALPEMGANKPPEWLADLIKGCVSKEKEDRPNSFLEVLQILDNVHLEAADHRTRFLDSHRKKEILDFSSNIIKFAPFIFIVCVITLILILLIENGNKVADRLNANVNNSNTKINQIVNSLNKAVTVVQKLDQNKEAIDKLYDKVVEEEKKAAEPDQKIELAPKVELEPKVAELDASTQMPEDLQKALMEADEKIEAQVNQQNQNEKNDDPRGPILKNRIKRFRF